jgi:hypothetical protein
MVSLLSASLLRTLPAAAQPQMLLEETFADNRNGWELSGLLNASAEIADGAMIVRSRSGAEGAFFTLPIPLSDSSDFDLTLALRQLSGPANMGYGLCWGARDDYQEFSVLLASSNRQYTILQMSRGRFTEVKRWTESELLEGGSKQDVLTVRRRGGQMHYLINGSPVFVARYTMPRGNRAGIVVYGASKLEVDYFYASLPEAHQASND